MTDDPKRKADEVARAEARLREEAARQRRQEQRERLMLRNGCLGCLGLVILALAAAFLLF